MKHLVLVGFMGAGKTTVGRRAAEWLRLPFVDTDSLIEERAGQSIPRIFAEHGETAFRDLESEIVRETSEGTPSVLSTGGGVMLRPQNVDALKRNGVVIYLKTRPETVLKRTRTRTDRPLLAGYADPLARIRELMDAREAHYAQAHVCVPADSGLEDVARFVVREWRHRGGNDDSSTITRIEPEMVLSTFTRQENPF